MYIADELLKLLVCEVCFENYNLKNRQPHALFPCGHTFCEQCIKQFRDNTCAACSGQFSSEVKNWALVNLIPRGRILDDYESVVEELRQGMENLEKLKKLNADRHELNNGIYDAIRKQINDRAAYLIEKINEGRDILLSSVKQIEDKWTNEMKIELDYETALIKIMNEFNARIDSEEIKTDEAKLAEFRALLETNLQSLSRRIEGKSAEEYVSFKVSEVDLEAAFDIENLFGELFVNDSADDDDRVEENLAERELQVVESLAKLDDLYSVIDDSGRVTNEQDASGQKVSVKPVGQKQPATSSTAPTKIGDVNYYMPAENDSLVPISYPYPTSDVAAASSSSKKTTKQKTKFLKSSKNTDSTNEFSRSQQDIAIQQQQQQQVPQQMEPPIDQTPQPNQFSPQQQQPSSPPRLCRLSRSSKSEYYGFELKTMKVDGKHIIGNVQHDSIAYRAGLREDDILLEVNNERVDGLDREHVVSKMLKHSKHVDLLVATPLINSSMPSGAQSSAPPQMMTTKARAQSMRDESNELSLAPSDPGKGLETRLIQLTRTNNQSYGFSISKNQSGGPPYISEIEPDSPAANSGALKEGDLLLKLNGVDLTQKSYSKILEIAKKQTDKGTKIDLEIADPGKVPVSKPRTTSYSDMAASHSADFEDNNNNRADSNSTDSSKQKFKIGALFRKNKKKL